MVKRTAWTLLICAAALAQAQPGEGRSATSAPSDLPPAATPLPPPVVSTPPPPAVVIRPEEKRLFGVIPNYKSIPAHDVVPPLDWKGKYKLATMDTFDPMAFVLVGVNAAQSQWSGQFPSLGQGVAGFGQRYIRSEADLILSNYITEAILPAALHLDPRFFRLGEGSAAHRTGYALSRIWLTKGDDGRTHFNSPELVGNAMAVVPGLYYYPLDNGALSSLGQRYAFQVGSDAVYNVLKEFWPDIHDRFLKRKSHKEPE